MNMAEELEYCFEDTEELSEIAHLRAINVRLNWSDDQTEFEFEDGSYLVVYDDGETLTFTLE